MSVKHVKNGIRPSMSTVGGWYKSRDYKFCEKKHKLVHKGDELSLYKLEDINM
jgi:hypothetical protein